MFALTLALVACQSDQELHVEQLPEPLLRVDAPAAGAWLPAGPVTVDGEWQGMSDVAVNGAEAELETDGSWAGQTDLVPGINLIEASGTDLTGDEHFEREAVIAGTFAAPDEPVRNAATVRLNQPGIDLVMTVAGGLVSADALGEQVTSMNPVYEAGVDVLGWEAAWLEADIIELSFGEPTLQAHPSGGLLNITVALPDLFVDIDAFGEVVELDYAVACALWADTANLTGTVGVDAVDGGLVVEVHELGIELDGFGYDLSLIPWDLEEYLFIDQVRSKVEEMLVDQLSERVPALLEEALEGLDLALDLDLMGTQLSASATFSDAWIDDSGIVLVTDIDLQSAVSTDHPYEGWLYRGVGQPELPTEGALVLGVSDDLINRLLFEVWRGGALDLSLSTDDGALDPMVMALLHADEGSIAVDALLPPVVVGDASVLELQIGELGISLDTPGGELGEHLLLATAVSVPLEITVVDGVLDLDLGEIDLTLMVRESDWGAGEEATTNMVQEILPIELLVGQATSSLNIELPVIQGLSVQSATTARHEGGAHTVVTVELSL